MLSLGRDPDSPNWLSPADPRKSVLSRTRNT